MGFSVVQKKKKKKKKEEKKKRKSQLNVLWKRLSYIVQIERKQTREHNNSGASAGVKLIAYSVHRYSREEEGIIQSLAESTIAADGLTWKNIQVGNRRRFAFASKCEFRLGGRLAVNSVGTRYPRHRKKVEVDIFSPHQTVQESTASTETGPCLDIPSRLLTFRTVTF